MAEESNQTVQPPDASPPEFLFPEGLLGFPDHKRFVLLEQEDYAPFLWLKSAEDESLAFVVIDPRLFLPDYRVEVRRDEVEMLGLQDPSQAWTVVLVVVGDDPQDTTANLKGPLILNLEKKLGRQLVLQDEQYTTRHFVLRGGASAGAAR